MHNKTAWWLEESQRAFLKLRISLRTPKCSEKETLNIQDYYDSFLSDIFNSSFDSGTDPGTKFLQRALDLVIDSGSLDDYDYIHSSVRGPTDGS